MGRLTKDTSWKTHSALMDAGAKRAPRPHRTSPIGQQFWNLTAVWPLRDGMWRFRCECGARCVYKLSLVRLGRYKSCGCRPRYADLTGQKFGRLTAIQWSERSRYSRYTYWHAQCECGNTIEVAARALVSGNTLSCGCLRSEKSRAIAATNHRQADGKFLRGRPPMTSMHQHIPDATAAGDRGQG